MMKIKKNQIVILSLVVILMIFDSCKKSYEDSTYHINYKIKNINVNLTANGVMKGDDEEPIDIKKLINEKDYGYYFFVPYGGILDFNFSQPVWIKQISFYLKKIDPKINKIMQMSISINPDSHSMPIEGIVYNLENNKKHYTITFPTQKISNILKYKSISLNVVWKNVAGNAHGEKIYLKNFKIILSDNEKYNPVNLFDHIKKKCLSKKDNQGYITYDNEYISTREVQDLVYYAINGNKEAEQYLNKLNPISAENGEFISGINEWYSLNKK